MKTVIAIAAIAGATYVASLALGKWTVKKTDTTFSARWSRNK